MHRGGRTWVQQLEWLYKSSRFQRLSALQHRTALNAALEGRGQAVS
tara:strand:- start:195 stop:332 length:138 start_codon:yes stop_codon:yes gene_type:complete